MKDFPTYTAKYTAKAYVQLDVSLAPEVFESLLTKWCLKHIPEGFSPTSQEAFLFLEQLDQRMCEMHDDWDWEITEIDWARFDVADVNVNEGDVLLLMENILNVDRIRIHKDQMKLDI